MSQTDIRQLLAFAGRLADAAAEVTLAHFRNAGAVDNKAGSGAAFDPVTVADRAAETAIRALIEDAYPDHGILGEEHAAKDSASGFTWVIDPIDGTRSYIIGVPLWGTLIGLEKDGQALLGLLDQPYLGERYCGSPQGAELATRQGRQRLATSGCTDLAGAKLGTTSPYLFAPGAERDGFAAVEARVLLSRYGGDCYFYGLLAAGQIDLVIEAGLNPYDIVALIPIIEAAGGVVTTWDGSNAARGGQIVAAATPQLHAAACAVLTGG